MEQPKYPILSQIPLVISPSLQPPHAVTLPYQFKNLPSALPASAVQKDTLNMIISDSKGFLGALEQRHNNSAQAYEAWRKTIEEEQLQEKRKIAPGYLDSANHLLTPDRDVQSKKKDDATSTNTGNQKDVSYEGNDEHKDKEQTELSELDRVFGKVSLDQPKDELKDDQKDEPEEQFNYPSTDQPQDSSPKDTSS